ncbi:autophagy-related protein [Delphinella strobiligena]|nr:autophagy-related protein [Delphinella strobiligena]
MDTTTPRRTNPPEYTLDIFASRNHARDILRGILHLIFFHRTFTTITPSTHEILDTTLPLVPDDNDLSTLIDQCVNDLLRQLDLDYPQQSGGRGQLAVSFSERKRRKGWFNTGGEEEFVWERWVVSLTLAAPKTEQEVRKVRNAMERSLSVAFGKVMKVVGSQTEHIPPITSNEGNPFPYAISVGRGNEGWGRGMRVF